MPDLNDVTYLESDYGTAKPAVLSPTNVIALGVGESASVVPPVISAVDPTVMTTVARTQIHGFDFTDDNDFRTIIVAAKYPSGRWDLIYDGQGFNPDYAGVSSITPIANGFRLEIGRTGGWLELGALRLRVLGVDVTGQANGPG